MDSLQSELVYRYPYLYHQSQNSAANPTAYLGSNGPTFSLYLVPSQTENFFGSTSFAEGSNRLI